MHHSYRCGASAGAVAFWILYSTEQKVRHTVTEDYCEKRGKGDVYHEREKKNGFCGEKVIEGILRTELQER